MLAHIRRAVKRLNERIGGKGATVTVTCMIGAEQGELIVYVALSCACDPEYNLKAG